MTVPLSLANAIYGFTTVRVRFCVLVLLFFWEILMRNMLSYGCDVVEDFVCSDLWCLFRPQIICICRRFSSDNTVYMQMNSYRGESCAVGFGNNLNLGNSVSRILYINFTGTLLIYFCWIQKPAVVFMNPTQI